MIRRIELHNFMSHANTVIEPADGLTVLVGANNSGKSAIVSALQILSDNTQGDYMVRHGESECRVKVVTDEGHRIEWRRIKGIVSYSINGEASHRLQGRTPESLDEVLRLSKVVSGDQGHVFDIHFGEQKNPIFLINEPGSRAATFFASSSDAGKLMDMQQRHREKGREAKREEDALETTQLELEDHLKQLEAVEVLETAVDRIEQERDGLIDLSARIETLWQIESALAAAMTAVIALNEEFVALESLVSPPKLIDVVGLENLMNLMTTEGHIEARETEKGFTLQGLKTPPRLVDLAPIMSVMERLEYLVSQAIGNEAAYAATRVLESPPKLAETLPLNMLCEEMTELQRRKTDLVAEGSMLGRLSGPPELFDTATLEKVIAQFVDLASQLRRADMRADILMNVTGPPRLEDDESLRFFILELGLAQRRVSVPEALGNRLRDLAVPPSLGEVSGLEEIIEEIRGADRAVIETRKDASKADQDCEHAEQDLREFARSQGICPTCGAQLDPDRIVELAASGLGGHTHG